MPRRTTGESRREDPPEPARPPGPAPSLRRRFRGASQRLPDLVRRLERFETVRPDDVAPPLEADANDEIGQVAQAFDAVHAEAVRGAVEQAELRRNVAQMFVNLARRSQTLVDRQIQLIDQPDHLATRMRRNDENPLVLAGEDSARRWTRPVRLVDVPRAAASEVEQYARVELTVAARMVGRNCVVEIEDQGVGLSSAQLAETNERLSSPLVIDVTLSKTIVVGRLPARHRVKVQLCWSPPGHVPGGLNPSPSGPATGGGHGERGVLPGRTSAQPHVTAGMPAVTGARREASPYAAAVPAPAPGFRLDGLGGALLDDVPDAAGLEPLIFSTRESEWFRTHEGQHPLPQTSSAHPGWNTPADSGWRAAEAAATPPAPAPPPPVCRSGCRRPSSCRERPRPRPASPRPPTKCASDRPVTRGARWPAIAKAWSAAALPEAPPTLEATTRDSAE